MNNKDKYIMLCTEEKSIPIFSQYWWLDTVCGENNWDVILLENEGRIKVSMPYFIKRICWQKIITMPPLTPFMGPWIRYPENQKYGQRLSYEKQVMTKLIVKLPQNKYFLQNFHYSITNWLPFYWKGFTQTTRYTYIIDDLNNLSNIFSNLQSNFRNKIRKAEKIVTVLAGLNVNEFCSLLDMTFKRQGLKCPNSKELIVRIDKVLSKRKSREIFYAIDNNKKIHSALYLIWDNQSAYVHMVGEDPLLRNSGAGAFLLWKALEYTKEVLGLQCFDFEGSMIESIEQVRRDFGAIQKPYYQIMRMSFSASLIKSIRNMYRNILK